MQTNKQNANKQTNKMQTNKQNANKQTKCKQTNKMQTNKQNANKQVIDHKQICRYKQQRQATRCNNNGLLIIPISSTCFGR